MKKILITITFVVISFRSASAQNLVTNGDFETNPWTGSVSLNASSPSGWTFSTIDAVNENFFDNWPSTGGWFIDTALGDSSQQGTATSVSFALLANTIYEFSYDFAGANNLPAAATVSLNGTTLATDFVVWGGAGPWTTRTFTYTPTVNETANIIVQGISGRSGGVAFNDFSVTQAGVIPEPSSTALLGLGAFGLIARRKRS